MRREPLGGRNRRVGDVDDLSARRAADAVRGRRNAHLRRVVVNRAVGRHGDVDGQREEGLVRLHGLLHRRRRPSCRRCISKLYTFYYKVDTLLDVYTLLAQRGSVYSEEGQRHRFGATLFDRMRNRASFEHTTTTVVKIGVCGSARGAGSVVRPVRRSHDATQGRRPHRRARERRWNQLPRRRSAVGTPEPVQFAARFVERLEGDAGHQSTRPDQQVGRNVAVWLST